MDVMRHPLTTIIVGLGLILATTARGGTARSRDRDRSPGCRLIEAGDHAAALTILEDALIEATAKDRPTILDLLRQSYEVLARKAEAAGKTRTPRIIAIIWPSSNRARAESRKVGLARRIRDPSRQANRRLLRRRGTFPGRTKRGNGSPDMPGVSRSSRSRRLCPNPSGSRAGVDGKSRPGIIGSDPREKTRAPADPRRPRFRPRRASTSGPGQDCDTGRDGTWSSRRDHDAGADQPTPPRPAATSRRRSAARAEPG